VPSRVIKETIWTSPNLNSISPLAERHFYRLLTAADDWGCFEATPLVVKGKCYPLRPETKVEDIEVWQKELADNDLIRFWEVGGRQYGYFLTFDSHNSLTAKHSPLTPCPPWLMDERGFDPRLATETLQAFERIGVAVVALSQDGKKPSYRAICEKAGCSMSTFSKYLKHIQTTSCYTPLFPTTAATPKNPNPNPNPNPRVLTDAGVAPASFPDWKELLEGSRNKVAVLVTAFRQLHPSAPPDDHDKAGGRAAGFVSRNKDPGYLLKLIWDSATCNISGSHWNYIEGMVRKHGTSKNNQRIVSTLYSEEAEFYRGDGA